MTTAKEKAEELYKRMYTRHSNIYPSTAIECALIAVDMVIENLSYDPSTGGKSNEFYWLDVKKELQKL
jgi:hypothetical protein